MTEPGHDRAAHRRAERRGPGRRQRTRRRPGGRHLRAPPLRPSGPAAGGVCRLCVVEIDGVEGRAPRASPRRARAWWCAPSPTRSPGCAAWPWNCCWSGHPPECGTCQKYLNCELQSLKQYLGVEELRVKRRAKLLPVNTGNPLFVYDPNKCVLCGRCVRACWELREVGVLHYREQRRRVPHLHRRGRARWPNPGCRFCGACAEVCPTGAIQDKEELVADKNRKAALVPCKSNCPAEIDVPRYVRFIKEGDYPGGRRGDPGEGALPLGAGLRLRPSLRERLPAGRGQRAHRHPRAQALRGRARRRQPCGRERRPRRPPPRSGWP